MGLWIFTLIIDNSLFLIFIGCLIYLLRYFYVIEEWECFWYSFYFMLGFIIIFLFFIGQVEFIICYFFGQILEPIIVLDPTIFMYTFLYFILNYVVLLTLPFFLLLFIIYSISINIYNTLLIFYSLCMIYYFIIIFWIIKYDLYLSNWFSFSYVSNFSLLFDFQLDIEKIIAFFWLDYWELFFFIYFFFLF